MMNDDNKIIRIHVLANSMC